MDYLDDFDDTTPAIYSRVLVIIYSLFLTPIGGAILILINLVSTRRFINIIWLVIALFIFEVGHLWVMGYYGPSLLTFFLPLIGITILLAFPVWNILLKGTKACRRKGVLVPLIVLAVIWVPLMILNFVDFSDRS